MKGSLIAFVILFISVQAFSQVPEDALRYSLKTGQGGTARVQALGGASISLGGEFTNLFENPAGLGFFKTGDFLMTPSVLINSNEAGYLGETSQINNNKVSLGASGAMFVTEYANRKLRNLTLGIGVNRAANFNNSISYGGANHSSTFSDQYVDEFINNQVTDDNDAATGFPFGSSMAFNTYLVNPTLDGSGNINGYFSLADPSYGLAQRMTKHTSGGIDDIALGVGMNFLDQLYIGGSLSIYSLHYTRRMTYSEDDMSGDTHNDFNFFEANEYLKTSGTGVQAKLGFIYRPVNDFQFGLTFHTPTFFQLSDDYNMTITTDPEGYEGQTVQMQSSSDLNNGRLLRTNYNLVTPLKVGVGGTYFISRGLEAREQKGFITADLEYLSYANSHFKDAENDASFKSYYDDVNDVIGSIYKPTINARLGGEIKLNTFMVRLGGAYYGNPYEDETSSLYKVSTGIGYRTGGFYIDLAYTYGFHKDWDYPYRLDTQAVSPAELSNNSNNVALTVGFKLNN